MATVRNAHADVRAATAPIARAPKMLRILRAGDLDLFVGNRLSTNTEIVANELWIGDGLGGFTAASGNPAGGTKNTNCAAWADIDGDGNYHAFTYARPLSVRPRSPRCRLPSRAGDVDLFVGNGFPDGDELWVVCNRQAQTTRAR